MDAPHDRNLDSEWSLYLRRYSRGEWRAPIFRDLILADAHKLAQDRGLVLLDIGCGGGFDGDAKIQASLAEVASQYIGIEPDIDIELGAIFTTVYRCRFEDAPIPPASVHMAFAVMVLEHFADPQVFWGKVHMLLRPGGVFWGFTVDARHWFMAASLLTERLHIKDWYLHLLHGTRGQDRYQNYAVYYRSNTPEQIERMTQSFRARTILNFHRVGQLDFYFPTGFRWLGRSLDRLAIRRGWPGSIMAVRVAK